MPSYGQLCHDGSVTVVRDLDGGTMTLELFSYKGKSYVVVHEWAKPFAEQTTIRPA